MSVEEVEPARGEHAKYFLEIICAVEEVDPGPWAWALDSGPSTLDPRPSTLDPGRAPALRSEVARLQDALARATADAASRKQAVELLSSQVEKHKAALRDRTADRGPEPDRAAGARDLKQRIAAAVEELPEEVHDPLVAYAGAP